MPTTAPTREVYWNIQGVWIMYALVVVMAIVFGYGAYRYYQLLMAGKPEHRFDRSGDRLRALLAHALAQGRTLRRRYAGPSHLLFSWGFVILFLGTVVVFIHEDLGTFIPFLQIMQGNFYLWFQSLALDLFGLGAIVGVAMAMLRRAGVVGRQDRLYRAPSDPRSLLDDGLILGGFLVILVTGFVIEGARIVATNDPWAAWSPVGYVTGLALRGLSESSLRGLHVSLWWFHLVLVLAWLAYLPYSKLRHIVTSPANIYFKSFGPKGALPYLDIEKAFEQDPPPIGIASLADLTWKDRLDVMACTECARCEQACPAARTGKALSPMLLVLDLRNQLLKAGGPSPLARTRRARGDESDAKGNVTADGRVDRALVASGALPAVTSNGTSSSAEEAVAASSASAASPAVADDAPAPLQLVGEVITDAVLWDCTTCRACMEACPVFIEHVPKIVEMRRNLVLVESRFEPELQRLFDNLEAAGNPWRFPRSDRAQWASVLEPSVPILGQDVTVDEIDVLYWVGCAGSYDERNQKVARALTSLLQTAGIRFAILGTRETCTGDPARRAGNEYLWQILAGENVATLNELGLGREESGDRSQESGEDSAIPAPPQKTILASCPHCFNTLKDEYPQLGGMYTVRHHAEYLAELVQMGKLRPTVPLDGDAKVAYHDPCYLGRYQDIYDQPRAVLDAIPGLERKEVRAGCRNNAMCCGAGGAKIWFEERRGTRVNHLRMEHIQAENPDQVAVACPYCMIMLEDGARAKGVYETLPILDISEFLTNSLAAKAARANATSSLENPPESQAGPA